VHAKVFFDVVKASSVLGGKQQLTVLQAGYDSARVKVHQINKC
jgi:hypothetical protein